MGIDTPLPLDDTETRAKHWPGGTLGWYADLALASPPREHTGKCRNLSPPTGFYSQSYLIQH